METSVFRSRSPRRPLSNPRDSVYSIDSFVVEHNREFKFLRGTVPREQSKGSAGLKVYAPGHGCSERVQPEDRLNAGI